MSKIITPENFAGQKAYGVVSFFARERDGLIGVIDLWRDLTPDAQRDTTRVTDAPQVVITELLRRGYPVNERIVLYMDENDVWDRIKVHNGHFDNFQVLHAASWPQAVKQLISAGVIDAKDTRKPPVVDKPFKI